MLSKTKAKYIQSLGDKKFRDQYQQFVAEGPKLVSDLLSSKRFRVDIICATTDWIESHKALLSDVGVEELISLETYELDKISQLKTAHKVVAVFRQPINNRPDLKNRLSLYLDEIQDPGNMGTIIRIADWFGIRHIICSPGCVDVYNTKVVQATMGSIGRMNLIYEESSVFFEANKHIPRYAATLDGKDISALPIVHEGILIIGNEGRGINPGILTLDNIEITIPKFGQAESLNAAVATGIILSHMVKR